MNPDERPVYRAFDRLCRVSTFSLAALGIFSLFALSACATRTAGQDTQHFMPINRSMAGWGTLHFNNRALQLDALEGEMKLEYVGAMKDSAGEDLAGASVFRVKNADKFFKHNREQGSFCSEPARWVALNSETGAPAWSQEIWVALLTIEDWSAYTPGSGGSCAGGLYVRSPTG